MRAERTDILVLENTRHLAVLVRYQLERAGYAVSVVDAPADLEAALSTHRPAAMLLAVELEGADGFDLARRVRPRFAGRIVFVTSRPENLEGPMRDAGGDALFTRPASPRALVRTFRDLGVQPALPTR